METYGVGFFKVVGEGIQGEHNYNQLTENGTKNTTRFMPEILWVRVCESVKYFQLVFKEIKKDFDAQKITESVYRRYMMYFDLLLSDTRIISGKLKENKELLAAVQQYRLSEALGKLGIEKQQESINAD